MRTRTMVVAVIATLAAAAAALGAGATKDPTSLILRKADMPAGSTYGFATNERFLVESLRAQGIKTRAASYVAERRSKTQSLQISGAVVATASAGDARKAFGVLVKRRPSPEMKPIRVLAVGEQQVALYEPPNRFGLGAAHLVVRKNTVLWVLAVELGRRPAPAKADILAGLQKYALKQRARVGSG